MKKSFRKIDLRDKHVYETPKIEDFGQIHEVTADRGEGSPWRHMPDGLLRKMLATKVK